MIEGSTIVKVRNRDNGTVGYTIPDLNNLHRDFQPNEVKNLELNELRKLSYLPGGITILKEYLVIEDNEEAVQELLGNVEFEYHYTMKDVEDILLRGSLDQLLDCLDFAPEGVIDLVKKAAVDLKIVDISKRQAILDKTGFDVTKAIEINKETEEKEEVKDTPHRRRVGTKANENEDGTSKRRVSTPQKYNVVS